MAEHCTAQMFPFPTSPLIQCEREPHADETHEGALRDYAYPGSVTRVTWLDSDRRTFRGEWRRCGLSCILPAGHRGNHEPG